MKKTILCLIIFNSCLFGYKQQNNTELQPLPKDIHPILEKEEEPPAANPTTYQTFALAKKKPTIWRATKRIAIGCLLALNGIGLSTDIVGMQQSQDLNNEASPIIAYNPDGNFTETLNCTYGIAATQILPSYIRNTCDWSNDICPCIIEECPPAQDYKWNFMNLQSSQIFAIGLRIPTLLSLAGWLILQWCN